MFILKEQMVQTLKLDLVFVFDCDPQSTQHIKSIVDSALHILKIKLK
jgi:transposase